MAKSDLEDSWKALRPDLKEISDGTLRLTAMDLQAVAVALSGKDDPEILAINPDRLQEEATTPNGLIVPPGTIHSISDSEFVGRMPVRTGLTVMSADDTNRVPLNWTVRELSDADLDERDSPEALAELAQQRQAPASSVYRMTYEHRGYTVLHVLQELWGTPWNAAAANFLQCLRPSSVRVTTGEVTLDASTWRVTVFLTEDNRIQRIEQEVEVGLVGFRNGQDASNYLSGHLDSLDAPQPRAYINPRGIARMSLSSEDD